MSPRKTDESPADTRVPMNPVEFMVLGILRDGPLHGYGLVQEMTERTDGRVRLRPGNLYRVLDRMMERGLLEPDGSGATEEERRTCYRITAQGRRVLVEEAELLRDIVAGVASTRRPGEQRA